MKIVLDKNDFLVCVQDLIKYQVSDSTVVDSISFSSVEGKQFAVTRIEVDFHNEK